MTNVIEQDLELDCVPQPIPRAREHAVYKLMPQLREAGLYSLPHLREQELLDGRVPARDEQHICLFRKQGSRRCATIAQVSKQDSTIAGLAQGEQRHAVIR